MYIDDKKISQQLKDAKFLIIKPNIKNLNNIEIYELSQLWKEVNNFMNEHIAIYAEVHRSEHIGFNVLNDMQEGIDTLYNHFPECVRSINDAQDKIREMYDDIMSTYPNKINEYEEIANIEICDQDDNLIVNINNKYLLNKIDYWIYQM